MNKSCSAGKSLICFSADFSGRAALLEVECDRVSRAVLQPPLQTRLRRTVQANHRPIKNCVGFFLNYQQVEFDYNRSTAESGSGNGAASFWRGAGRRPHKSCCRCVRLFCFQNLLQFVGRSNSTKAIDYNLYLYAPVHVLFTSSFQLYQFLVYEF